MSWWLIGAWLVGWFLLWRLPRPQPSGAGVDAPPVSVVIPARNEADRLPHLLGSLVAQTAPPSEIVVVDDGSTDGTAEVAGSFPGVRVVTATAVPDGWTGKSWACATGVTATSGEVIVFLDADVDLAPDALASVVDTWARHGGMISVQPHHHIRRPVEALSLPFNVITMMGLGVGSLRPGPQWGAAGPCVVTSRRDYAAAGGHAAVRGEVAEDLALAERYLEVGLPIRCLGGGRRIRYRMYRDLRGIVEGWSKNLATGASRTPRLRGLLIGLWVTAVLTALLEVFGAVTDPSSVGVGDPVVALYLAVTAQLAVMGRQVGRFGPAALAWPILFAFFVAVFARSTVRTLLVRQVTWSGRDIPVAARH
jgi:4,4'-diaponeurosporenoate glycosyltransferase